MPLPKSRGFGKTTVPQTVMTVSRVFVAVPSASVLLIAPSSSPSVPSPLLNRTPLFHLLKPASHLTEFTNDTISTNLCSDLLLCDPLIMEALDRHVLPSAEYRHSSPTLSPPSSQFLDTQQFEEQEYSQYDFSECDAHNFYSPNTLFEHVSPFEDSTSSPFTPFIDQIISQVRNEIESEKQIFANSASIRYPSHIMTPSNAFQPAVSNSYSEEIVQCQGKQYKITIEAVNEECSVDETGCLSPVSNSSTNGLKRQHSFSSESENDNLTYEPHSKKKPISLALLSPEEVAERKKAQNRMAALKYREKQRNAKKDEKSEISQLTDRNTYLRVELDRLKSEVNNMKTLLFQQFGSVQ